MIVANALVSLFFSQKIKMYCILECVLIQSKVNQNTSEQYSYQNSSRYLKVLKVKLSWEIY